MEHRNKTWSDFVRDHLAAVSAAAGGLILAVMVLLFTPGLYAVGWHYAACYFLVIACWLCSRAGKTRLALALVVLTCVVAVAGFFHYNGLTLEQFAWAFLKSELLCAGNRVFKAENIYYKALGRKEGADFD